MRKYGYSFAEDSGIFAFIIGFIALGVWGVVNILLHPPERWYQLPVFILFMLALYALGFGALRQQMRLRTCPKCQATMQRAPMRSDGIRRQKCPQCGTVMKTARKNSLQALDEVEASA